MTEQEIAEAAFSAISSKMQMGGWAGWADPAPPKKAEPPEFLGRDEAPPEPGPEEGLEDHYIVHTDGPLADEVEGVTYRL
eukprot:CAMPEP_0179351826 /NCGR_PEP_ID=MMETSP0797-20121207/75477_1 /TAXON_ID=47934 /ORGANISM="Dinophysis acuminata, Strain DAEP01" /LENGTH=79 /DNA_ID=CAMNT_0021066793 /DNA_START=12 /DNA_END=248 /DNA_ORIENTATION=-